MLIRLVPNGSFSPRQLRVMSTHLGSNRISKEQTWKGVTLGMVPSARSTAQTTVWAVMQAAIDEQTMVLWWPLNPSIRR